MSGGEMSSIASPQAVSLETEEEVGWTNAAQEAEKQRAYEDELIHRYNAHLYLSRVDRAEARRLIKARSKATGPAAKSLEVLRSELASELAHSMATGFGDHAKIARLDAAIAKAEGRS